MEKLDILFRKSSFSFYLLEQVWPDCSTLEKLQIINKISQEGGNFTDELLALALDDNNPVVRILAASCSHISVYDKPVLHAKAGKDPSSLVRVARDYVGSLPSFSIRELPYLNHKERLAFIALNDHIPEVQFASFIEESLNSNSINEKEAAECIWEYLQNPKCIEIIRDENNVYSDYPFLQGFRAIWNLTTCTPEPVHTNLAWNFPMFRGGIDRIPDEILDKMSQTALSALAFRQYAPLLERIEKYSDKYSDQIKEAAKSGNELARPEKKESRKIT